MIVNYDYFELLLIFYAIDTVNGAKYVFKQKSYFLVYKH